MPSWHSDVESWAFGFRRPERGLDRFVVALRILRGQLLDFGWLQGAFDLVDFWGFGRASFTTLAMVPRVAGYGATAAWRGSFSTLSRCVGRCCQRQRPAPRRNKRQDKRGPTGAIGTPPHQSWRFSVLVVGAFLFPISLPKVAGRLGSSAFAQASGTGCLRKHRMTSWPSVGRRHGGLLGDWRTGDCGDGGGLVSLGLSGGRREVVGRRESGVGGDSGGDPSRDRVGSPCRRLGRAEHGAVLVGRALLGRRSGFGCSFSQSVPPLVQ